MNTMIDLVAFPWLVGAKILPYVIVLMMISWMFRKKK